MQVGGMGVPVDLRRVAMGMCVPATGRNLSRRMTVDVVRVVVTMPVIVLQFVVFVRVIVPLGRKQPGTEGHEEEGPHRTEGHRLVQEQDGKGGAEEGS